MAPIRAMGSRPSSSSRLSLNSSSDNGVTINSASRGVGTHWRIRRGVRNTTASVINPTASAAGFQLGASISELRDATTPPPVLTPMKGPSCSTRMMKPIPDMKPETTE